VKVTLPPVLLRIEGATLLALSALLYGLNGGSWLLFVLLFLLPDFSMLGYLAGSRVGTAGYNLFHTYAAPSLLAALGCWQRALWSSPWPSCGSRTSGSIGWSASG
jgi:hypothetical protein